MKKFVLVLAMMSILMVGMGCNTGDPTHKDTLILVTNIAINHLEFEKQFALEDCEEEQILPANCEDALDYQRWIGTLAKFEQYVKDANDLELRAEYLNLIVDTIIAEMGDDIDARTQLYISDIKIVIAWMIEDQETRTLMKARRAK